MFPWHTFVPFVFIVAITPGPNNIMTMNIASQKGIRKTLPFNFGVIAGVFLIMILCAAFSSLLYTFVPRIVLPMKILGAAYMLYMALKILLPSKKVNPKDTSGSFWGGVVFQFINPKIIIFGMTIMASYILPWYTSIPALIGFSVFLALIGFPCTLCWTVFGSLFSRIFSEHGKILNIIMALLLAYCAVSLFL